jgi:hypothetical protein
MILVVGQRLYGKIDALGPASVSTQFAYFQFLPFVPEKSFLRVGESALVLPLVGRSVAAGYLRAWGPVLAIVGAILAASGSLLGGVILALAGLGLATWAWGTALRPRGEALARLEAYEAVVGAPVDPAYIVSATRRDETREAADEWLADIARRAEQTIDAEGADLAASYRASGRATDWRQIAERAEAATLGCRRAALTLARMAWARGEDAAGAHERIWKALVGMKAGDTT